MSFPARAEREPVIAAWSDERRLLVQIRDGDRAAAEEIVERTYSAVYASLYRLCGDGDLAADLTQDTYRKAWEALGSFDGRSQLFTWLYRIAYTTFLNHIRRPRLMTSLDAPESPEIPDRAQGADELLSVAEEADKLVPAPVDVAHRDHARDAIPLPVRAGRGGSVAGDQGRGDAQREKHSLHRECRGPIS